MRLVCGTWMILTVLAIAATMLQGCTNPSEFNGGLTVGGKDGGQEFVGVYQLSRDLQMTVDSSSESYAKLRDGVNIVMVYPDPCGQVYVNGRPVGQNGGIFLDQGEIVIPVGLVETIRLEMKGRLPAVKVPPPADGPDKTPPPAKDPNVPAIAARGKVMVDPGHGGKDPGTRSVRGFVEKGLVLEVGQKLQAGLRTSGVTSTMTRSDDRFIELEDRSAMANRAAVDLMVSVHADWAQRATARGFTIYIARSASARSVAAATAIERNLSAAGFPSNGIRRADFKVLKNTNTPAVLVELGYMSNYYESAQLQDTATRTTYANAIARGVCEFLKGK